MKYKIYIAISIITSIFVLINQNVQAQQNIAQQAYAIFEQSCMPCHGQEGSFKEALLIEYSELLAGGTVVPGNPEDSVLYQRLIETNEALRMPQQQPPLSPEAIETIRQWIAAGAPDWNIPVRPNTDFITPQTMLETIETHVKSLAPFDRTFARYFTSTHLYNAGETDEALKAYQRALSKLVNSLSWGREIVEPKSIDPIESIFYIDLRDYQWEVGTNRWTQIEKIYPYTNEYKAPTETTLHEKLISLQETLNCEVPFLHVDWFIANASLPPLYHDILELPLTERELEEKLEVSVKENIQNAPGKRVWRAGFNDSGVSNHNRVVERHTSQHGAYWKSYDFAGSVDTQNIFTHPISFEHDGSEIIFNLPNGLQAYYLANQNGNRLNVAPTDIVSNPAASDPAVRNGLSCIGCHTEGMKKFEDEVRDVVEKNANPPYDKSRALSLYVEKATMDAHLVEDTERYRQALEKTGGMFGGIEPVQRFHEVFQGPIDATHAAASLGLQTEILLEKIQQNVGLQNLGLLVLENGTIKRDTWTQHYTDIVHALDFPQESIETPVEPIPEIIPGTIVNFPDPNLHAAVALTLGKARYPQDPLDVQITVEDMADLTQLYPGGLRIQDLEGIQFATNLASVTLNDHNISDLSPLSGLTQLETLWLYRNNISDLSPLTGLTQLKEVHLYGNNISDVSPLAGLTQLETLSLGSNNVSDISPLTGLIHLETLSLSDNSIFDLSPLAALTELKSLHLSNNNISDLSPLAGLTKLESLFIGDYDYLGPYDSILNSDVAIGTLLPVSSREETYTSYNNILDVSPLEGLTELKRLGLSGNNISDASPLEGLPKLETLDLSGNNISDISVLSGLTGLKRLWLYGNNISDISLSAELTELEHLYLDDNNISDLSPLADRTELDVLSLNGNNIRDVSPLAGLTGLSSLALIQNKISDVSPLTGLTELKRLWLSVNKISDVSPLAGLTELRTLDLRNNNISDISPLKAFFTPRRNDLVIDDSIKSDVVRWEDNPGFLRGRFANKRFITGKWLWVVVPGNHQDWGNGWKPMANASDGAITEAGIAATGATEGASVGENVWELHEWNPSDPLFFNTDIGEHLETLGIEGATTFNNIVYGCTFLDSPQDQETTLYIPRGYFVKAWLNGNILYSAWGSAETVPVTLRKGKNILLFGVSHGSIHDLFRIHINTEFNISIPGVTYTLSNSPINAGDTFTLDIGARNVIDLADWQFDISFNPTVLEVLEVNEGDFMKQDGGSTYFQKGTIDNTAGKIEGLSSAILTDTGVNGTGVLLSVTFKAKTEVETQVALHNFQLLTISGETLPAGPHEFIFAITPKKEPLTGDVNNDGQVNIRDLILVSRSFGKDASDNPLADINQDGTINIQDLILVAQHIGESTDSTAAPTINGDELTPTIVQTWIKQAQIANDGSIAFQQGIENLQKLLTTLIPEKTALLANYPNPFNPETWIPYHLSKPTEVTLTIYTTNGTVVRTLTLGHQAAGMYQSRERAAHWNGKNEQGELVSSGIYFYTLTAGDFTATRKMLILK